MLKLNDPVDNINGCKKSELEIIKREYNLSTIEDFINFYPYKHIVVKKINNISEIKDKLLKCEVEIKGIISDLIEKSGKNKSYLTARFYDASGEIYLYWFRNINKIKNYVKTNINCVIRGELSLFNNSYSIIHPTITNKEISCDKLLPCYSVVTSAKNAISTKTFRKINMLIFNELEPFEDYLPKDLVLKYRLMPEYDSLKNIHIPKNLAVLNSAIRRLKFDEIFLLQLKRHYFNLKNNSNNDGIICNKTDLLSKFYKDILKFDLTNDQKAAVKDIYKDISSGKRMNRLLHGDVGSGKTLVSFISSLIVVDSGYQVCILVPTEVLAKQHYLSFEPYCKELGINIAVITSSTSTKIRNSVLEGLSNGEINIVIGTHSLLNNNIKYKKLGLVIIDEQHKFGVIQRSNVIKESVDCDKKPHILLMTATPIPRTLSMVLYDNFAISTIKELPSNRKTIKTVHIYDNSRKFLYDFIKKEIEKGHQIYFIYPLISESESVDLNNLTKAYRELSLEFYYVEIGVVHGLMNSEMKEKEMTKFKNNETKILISTTIIEVGINVPNATVMVIENADRYGLAQLHQIRGRVGRGDCQSYCFLVTKKNISQNSKERLNILVKYNDGFIISEEDLRIRGGGDIYGEEQSGEFKLKIANLYNDINMLEVAKNEIRSIIKTQEDLDNYPQLKTKIINYNIDFKNV